MPCAIGYLQIEGALCDLGASVSMMSLSLQGKFQLQDLQPTSLTVQLAYHSIKRHVGILEDVPVQVVKFVIPYGLIVMDMDENPQVPITLRRPFLATAGAVIDV